MRSIRTSSADENGFLTKGLWPKYGGRTRFCSKHTSYSFYVIVQTGSDRSARSSRINILSRNERIRLFSYFFYLAASEVREHPWTLIRNRYGISLGLYSLVLSDHIVSFVNKYCCFLAVWRSIVIQTGYCRWYLESCSDHRCWR